MLLLGNELRKYFRSGRYRKDKGEVQAPKDKGEVQATISADVADGHNAQLDASLKLLSEDDPKLLLPNSLEDGEIEATVTRLSGANYTWVAGQEQEHARPSSPFDEVAAAKESKRRYRTDAMMGKHQAEASQQQQHSLAVEASALHIPTAKRQKRDTSPSRETGNIDLVNGSGLAAAVPVSYHRTQDNSSRPVPLLILTSMYHAITIFFTQSHATNTATGGSMEA